jgi:hypothetical protein
MAVGPDPAALDVADGAHAQVATDALSQLFLGETMLLPVPPEQQAESEPIRCVHASYFTSCAWCDRCGSHPELSSGI